jgi:glycosyltransferase involved in cell wall biosynthesis
VIDELTVVITARDAAATLGTALASVAGQSMPPDAVLVVDDGSTDDTARTAEAWSDLLPITVERLPDSGGLGEARAHTLALVETPLVATIDADDAWFTDHLRAMRAAHSPRTLVFARDFLWSPGAWLRASPRELPAPSSQLRELVRGNLSSAGILFARDDYERVGGYRRSLSRSEDWDLYLRMVRDGVRLVLAAEPTLLYRISSTSVSAGYGTADADVEVLEYALAEAAGAEEREWVEHELRRRRARRSLARALEAGQSGRAADARRLAREAWAGGDRKIRAIASALLVAPGPATRAQTAVSRRRWSGGDG